MSDKSWEGSAGKEFEIASANQEAVNIEEAKRVELPQMELYPFNYTPVSEILTPEEKKAQRDALKKPTVSPIYFNLDDKDTLPTFKNSASAYNVLDIAKEKYFTSSAKKNFNEWTPEDAKNYNLAMVSLEGVSPGISGTVAKAETNWALGSAEGRELTQSYPSLSLDVQRRLDRGAGVSFRGVDRWGNVIWETSQIDGKDDLAGYWSFNPSTGVSVRVGDKSPSYYTQHYNLKQEGNRPDKTSEDLEVDARKSEKYQQRRLNMMNYGMALTDDDLLALPQPVYAKESREKQSNFNLWATDPEFYGLGFLQDNKILNPQDAQYLSFWVSALMESDKLPAPTQYDAKPVREKFNSDKEYQDALQSWSVKTAIQTVYYDAKKKEIEANRIYTPEQEKQVVGLVKSGVPAALIDPIVKGDVKQSEVFKQVIKNESQSIRLNDWVQNNIVKNVAAFMATGTSGAPLVKLIEGITGQDKELQASLIKTRDKISNGQVLEGEELITLFLDNALKQAYNKWESPWGFKGAYETIANVLMDLTILPIGGGLSVARETTELLAKKSLQESLVAQLKSVGGGKLASAEKKLFQLTEQLSRQQTRLEAQVINEAQKEVLAKANVYNEIISGTGKAVKAGADTLGWIEKKNQALKVLEDAIENVKSLEGQRTLKAVKEGTIDVVDRARDDVSKAAVNYYNLLGQTRRIWESGTAGESLKQWDDLLKQQTDALHAFNNAEKQLDAILNLQKTGNLIGDANTAELFNRVFKSYESTAEVLGHSKMKEWIAKTWGLKTIANVVSPSSTVAGNKLKSMDIVYNVQKLQATQLAQYYRQLSEAEGLPFVMDGIKVKNVVGTPNVIDMISNASKYQFADDLGKIYKSVADHPHVQMLRNIQKALDQFIVDKGLQIGIKTNDEIYFARIVKELASGIKGDTELALKRYWETAQQGIEAGVKYEENYMKAFELHLKTVLQMAAEDNYLKAVKTFANTKQVGLVDWTVSKSTRATNFLKGDIRLVDNYLNGKISQAQLKGIERYAPELNTLIKGSEKNRDLLVQALKKSQETANLALKNAQETKGFVDIEGFKFPKNMANEIKETMWGKDIGIAKGGLNLAEKANQIGRSAKATSDLSVWFNQGLPLMFNNTRIWSQSLKDSLQAVADPTWMRQFAKTHSKTIREMIADGYQTLNTAEMAEGADILGKIPLVGQLPKAGSRNYNAFMDAARVYLWEFYRRPGQTKAQLADMGAVIDNMMGSMNTTKLGVGTIQKQIENSFLSFAMRYRRSGLAFMADTVRGGIRGEVARKTMTNYILAGTLAYAGVSTALGQKINLDPTNPLFTTINVGGKKTLSGVIEGGTNIKLGHQYNAMLRMLAKTISGTYKKPGKILTVGDFFEDVGDFPVTRYLRGQGSWLLGTAWSIASNETYLGEPITDNWKQFGRFMASQFTPIWADSLVFGGENSTWQVPLEIGGWNAFQTSQTYAIYRSELETECLNRTGKTPDELKESKDPKDVLAYKEITATPRLKELEDKLLTESMSKYEGSNKEDAYHVQYAMNNLLDRRKSLLWDAEKQYDIHKNIWTLRTAQRTIDEDYQKGIKDIQAAYPKVFASWGHARDRRPEGAGAYELIVRYNDIFSDTQLQTLEGQAWFDRYGKLVKEYMKTYGEEGYRFAKEYALSGKDLPPLYKFSKLNRADIYSSGYWEIPREQQAQWLREHQNIDALLYTEGYRNAVQTQDASDISKNLLDVSGYHRNYPMALDKIEYDKAVTVAQGVVDKLSSQAKLIQGTDSQVHFITEEARKAYNFIIKSHQSIPVMNDDKAQQEAIARFNEYINILKNIRSMADLMPKNDVKLELLKAQIDLWLLQEKSFMADVISDYPATGTAGRENLPVRFYR